MKKLNQPMRMRAASIVGIVMRETGRAMTAAFAAAITSIAVAQEPCSWSPVADGVTNGAVFAFATFDDGTGEALYAGGIFTNINGFAANGIARWDGEMWHSLGDGVDGFVRAMVVFDDGSGPALYVGGEFESAGGSSASNIARWDGQSWTAIGSGVNGPVRALEIFDNGSRSALYVGGSFTLAGGLPTANIARWDGGDWSSLGDGLVDPDDDAGGTVYALEVFDDGTGARLHAGGRFTQSGGAPLHHLARWTGRSWESVGGGIHPAAVQTSVRALLADCAADSPQLFVGGRFDEAGSVAAANIARWDGTSWSSLMTGIDTTPYGFVASLAQRSIAGSSELYVGGSFHSAGTVMARQVVRWDGEAWSTLNFSISGQSFAPAYALQFLQDESGHSLFAGGAFQTSNPDPISMRYIARWHLCPLPPTILRVPDDHPTIQQAILAAEDGNEIHVAPGVYSEAIDFLGRNIVIRSEDGPEVTIIEGQGISGSLVTFASAEAPDARLEGFTMTGGNATSGGALRVFGGASPTIVRCRFVENAATTGGAVEIAAGSAPEFINCIFKNNTAANGSAMSATNAVLTLTRCSFFDNIATEQAAIHLAGGEATIVKAALLGNSAPDAPGMRINGADVTLTDSAILANIGSGSGAIVNGGGTLAISGTRFCANEPGDLTGDWTDGGGNDFLTDCVTDTIVHVPADFATIQAAIDWSLTGFEVVVAPGEYDEAIDFMGRAITLRSSDGPESTLIDGANDVEFRTVRFISGEGRDSVLDGFTVMNRWPFSFALVHVAFSSSPGIRNCIIRNDLQNTQFGLGGLGIAGGSSPRVVDCEIRECTRSGVSVYASSPELINCTIHSNEGFNGGGVLIDQGCQVLMLNCSVVSNVAYSGGGSLALLAGFGEAPIPSTLHAINCRFDNNTSVTFGGGGGIGMDHGTAIFENCTMIGNEAVYSAGVVAFSLCNVEFIGCRIADNMSSGFPGGGLRIGPGGPSVVRFEACELSGNTSPTTGGGIFVHEENASSQLFLADTLICSNSLEQIDGDYIDEGGNVITEVCLTADFNRDGLVNVFDLQILLAAWGDCPDPDCPADLNDDGAVNVVDLLSLLAEWS